MYSQGLGISLTFHALLSMKNIWYWVSTYSDSSFAGAGPCTSEDEAISCTCSSLC